MMKKLVALLMALAMLCSSIAAFAEPVPNADPSSATAIKPEDYVDKSDMDEWKKHEDHVIAKSGQSKKPIAATCTTPEYQWYICKDEPVRFWMPVGDPLGHDFSEFQSYVEGKAPTYTEGGEGIFKCSRCDATETRDVDKQTTKYGPLDGFDRYMETPLDKPHKHGWCKDEANKEPTCEENGYYYVLCADCGQYYEYVGDKTATGHTWRDEEDTLVEIKPKRTCTVDGVEHWTNYCTVCQKDIKWTTTLPAYGHSYRDQNGELTVEGEVKQEADCTHNEIRRFTCTRVVDGVVCGYFEDIEIKNTAKGHTWETGESQETHDHWIEQVTCAKDGSYGKAVICDRCGEADPDSITTVKEIKALDHTKEWKGRILGIDDDGEIGIEPDREKFLKDLYDGLKAVGVKLDKPFKETSIQDAIAAIQEQHITPDVLIKVLDNITVDMYPDLTYTYPSVDKATGTVTNKVLDLSKVDAIPEYEIDVKIQIGDGSEGSENPLDEVIVKGLIHETKVTYNAPTCTASGSIVLTCTECDDEYVIELPKLEHLYVPIRGVRGINDLEYDLALIKDCTKANSILQKCLLCGHCYNQAIEPAKKHTIELPEYEDGYLYGECMIVGFVQQKEWDDAPVTYKVNYSEDLDADYEDRVEDAFKNIATCRDFDVIVKCAVGFCEYTEKIHVAAYTNHVANGYIIDKDPTCTDVGVQTFNCADCGEFHTDYDDPNGHTEVNGKTLVEPKCTEKGSREIMCSVCKEVLGTEDIPALDHHWLQKDTGANCAEGKIGLRYEYCSRCGETRNEETYEGHVIGIEHGRNPATCELPGTRYGVCEICHNDVEEVIQPLGHSYEWDTYEHTCWTKENPTPKGHYCEEATCKPGAEHGNICWHVCTTCGKEISEDDGTVVEHDIYKKEPNADGQRELNRFVIKELPACDKTGKAEYVCSRCEYHEVNYELPALPHNYQFTFDEATGAYNLVCTKMDNTELGLTNLYNKMIETSYKDNKKVAEAIVEMLAKSTGDKIKGTGCGDKQLIEIRETKYVVTKLNNKFGQVELVEGALEAKDPVYVRLAWNYSQANGDNICFVTIAEIEWDEVECDDYWCDREHRVVGTFRCSGLQMPDGWECNFCRVDVVADPNADDLFPGQYKDYGWDYI